MARADLFPPIDPFATGRLPVDPVHTLYWEQCGRPNGTPIVFLHGGPGAGASVTHRRFFDPSFFRIIIFDQRGAGRSTPLGEIEANTTAHLVDDMERLREELGVDRWHVFGGSWGSTLALAYAIRHPDRCLSLILRGIFLMRQSEVDWFLYRMRAIFPEAWRDFTADLGPGEDADILEAYFARLTHADREVRARAARAWSIYEGACSTLLPNPEIISSAAEQAHALGLARIEAHYFRNNRFAPESWILDNLDRVRSIPAVIVQGRYDVVCPIATADEVHRAWPEADYIVIPDAGHSALEPGIRAALIRATERLKSMR